MKSFELLFAEIWCLKKSIQNIYQFLEIFVWAKTTVTLYLLQLLYKRKLSTHNHISYKTSTWKQWGSSSRIEKKIFFLSYLKSCVTGVTTKLFDFKSYSHSFFWFRHFYKSPRFVWREKAKKLETWFYDILQLDF